MHWVSLLFSNISVICERNPHLGIDKRQNPMDASHYSVTLMTELVTLWSFHLQPCDSLSSERCTISQCVLFFTVARPRLYVGGFLHSAAVVYEAFPFFLACIRFFFLPDTVELCLCSSRWIFVYNVMGVSAQRKVVGCALLLISISNLSQLEKINVHIPRTITVAKPAITVPYFDWKCSQLNKGQ